MKSFEIKEIRRKSTEDKKPTWNRAKVYIGAADPNLQFWNIMTPDLRKSMKSIKIRENRGNHLTL